MIRWITGALYGLFFWLAADFLFYSGIYVHYIKANHIPVFFNPFFVDHQLWWLWVVGTAVLGAVFMWENRAVKGALLLTVLLLSAVTWVPSWGEAAGYAFFAREGVLYRFGEREVSGVRLFSADGIDYVRVAGKSRLMRYPVANRVR